MSNYRDWLNARRENFDQDISEYGVWFTGASGPLTGIELLVQFYKTLNSHFVNGYGLVWEVNELLIHPREALCFCDGYRRIYGFYDLPDDVILRALGSSKCAKQPVYRQQMEGQA